ncbi:MAG: phosphonate metabolism protein PhnP [Gammaproteobacteria bacterium HGW-Gammaproteobacteria-11]|nr:MAG: phosphonate metabolism protein PhnP [Gammaproteobacteria bacterium HGW-Gammaproteobacteria-11]
MRVTFLGTGAAGGVPLHGCNCPACARARKNRTYVRQPCSALVETSTTRILLDAGLMDLQQHIPATGLDAILLTHYHPDHVQGLFHLRWGVGEKITVWGPPDSEGCADLYRNPGLLSFQTARKFQPIVIGDLRLTPLPMIHSKPTLGYAIEGPDGQRFAYLTDTIGLPPKSSDYLKHWGEFSMALDCSYPPRPAPVNHNDLNMALACIEQVKPTRSWLTHIGHQLDSWLLAQSDSIPLATSIAKDGLVVEIGRK